MSRQTRDCDAGAIFRGAPSDGAKPPARAAAARTGRRAAAGRGLRWTALGISLVALAGGCSSTDEILSNQPPAAAPAAARSASFADRFRNLFGGGSDSAAVAQSGAPGAAQSGAADVTCPPTDIRQGAATLQMNAPGADQALAVRYQATFARTARQCAVNAGTLSIKVGVQGRLILGPAGTPGDTTVPLRYVLVQEGIQPKTIWSKLYMVPVAIPSDQLNVPFTHVMEDMSVPMPPREELDRYVIYVGFDPQGAAQEKKPPRGPKPKSG